MLGLMLRRMLGEKARKPIIVLTVLSLLLLVTGIVLLQVRN